MSYSGIILWLFFTFQYVARCTTQTIIKHIRITCNAHGKLSFTDMVILTSIHFSSKLTVSWQPSQVVNVSLQTVLVLKPLLLGSQESWITLRATLPNFIIYYTITEIDYLQEVNWQVVVWEISCHRRYQWYPFFPFQVCTTHPLGILAHVVLRAPSGLQVRSCCQGNLTWQCPLVEYWETFWFPLVLNIYVWLLVNV